MAAAATAAPVAQPAPPSGVVQAVQLTQTINSAVAAATADPTITLVVCLFDEAMVQINRFATGKFVLASAIDGFSSCLVAYGDSGAPDVVVPGDGVGETVAGQTAPGTVTRAQFVAPAAGTFTSGYGSRWGENHWGIDIANTIGTPIVAVAAGTVISAGPASGFGLWVRIRHNDGTVTVYGHNDVNLVSVGDTVRTNQIIARIGNRGDSTGPHVHFEVIAAPYANNVRIDPLPWLRARGVTI